MSARTRRALRAIGDRGASAVEYGLMVAAVAGVIAVLVFGFGTWLDNVFTKTGDCLAAQQDAGAGFPTCPERAPGR
ncbi:Flp family type IVb pilin [Spongisporangium articulatum]|uniref:Flp family type IVb pilin n=1 Tax=Spongisporangium articulatum TaxID=3362603 RepID=A0ABW8ASW1_9ACTN